MPTEQAHALVVGESLGPYRIDALLGAGGMGVVYRATDRELRRTVAIKMVDRSRHTPIAMQQLLQEARVAASLNHPAICGVHEVRHVDGEPFIVLEHVDGTLLSDIIARTAGLPVETVIHYVMQMVDGVAHAHAHGIVHGDLKASNVMVGRDGRVKILDFGLAVEHRTAGTGPESDTTRAADTSTGAGTVPYMAPELLRGSRADARSDIWALGVILFEMLAGSLPFRGNTAYEVAAAILSEAPRSLSVRVPAALRSVVTRCLAKAPTERFQTAGDLASALDDLA